MRPFVFLASAAIVGPLGPCNAVECPRPRGGSFAGSAESCHVRTPGGSMNRRLGIVSAAMLIAGIATLAGQGPSVTSGTARVAAGTAPSRTWVLPRTPDGQPDLQGFWSNSTYVPLERPNGVTKEFYTPEEAAAIRKNAASREQAQTKPGTVDDVHYDFSQFGLDRSQAAQAPNLRTSLIIDPPDGRIPPMTEEGRRRVAEREAAAKGVGRWDSAESNQLDDRCLIMAGAGPPMMDAAYNSNYHIVQAPGYVMILTEMIHDVRIIPLDGRPAPPGRVRQWMGTSRGRWDGDTLVVETTNFNGKNPFRNSSDRIRVDRAIPARLRSGDPLRLHHRRRRHLDAALERRDADAEDHGAALRARVPRRAISACTTRWSGPGSRSSAPPRRPVPEIRERHAAADWNLDVGGGARRWCGARVGVGGLHPATGCPRSLPGAAGAGRPSQLERHLAGDEHRALGHRSALGGAERRARSGRGRRRAGRTRRGRGRRSCPTGPRRWPRRKRTWRTG